MKYFQIIFSISFILILNFCRLADSLALNINFLKQAEEYRNSGFAYYKQGNLEKAHQYLKKAIYLNPQYAVAHNDLGIVYESRGLKELAIKKYSEAIGLDPGYAPPYMNLALLYHEQGNTEKALFYLRERVKLGKKDDLWRKKAEQLLAMMREGSNVSSTIIRTQKKSIDKTEKINAAMALMNESIKQKAKVYESRDVSSLERGKIYYKNSDYAKALKEFMAVKESDPGNPELAAYIADCQDKMRIDELYNEGRSALEKGDFAGAIDSIKELLLLDPMYKDAEDILISVEKERFIQETKQDEPIILRMP